MAAGIPTGLMPDLPTSARVTAAQRGRKFGFTIGAAMLVLAAAAYWRGSRRSAPWLAGIGSALLIAAVATPALLAPVERAWMAGAAVLSRITTPVFMGIVYFLVFTPVSLVRRMLGKRSLVRRGTEQTFWVRRADDARRSDLERQF